MYDAIIVGARCAGSPTAMLLARKGYRVLLLDKSTFPSDIMSTHFIHLAGVVRLKRWGLLQKLLDTGCPPIAKGTLHFGENSFSPPIPATLPKDVPPETLCPRRTVLDKLLVDAAVDSGAELREGFAVREVLTDNGRVIGVRGGQRGSSDVQEEARIVIGADGLHSFVAKSVKPPEYDTIPSLSFAYYSYWSGVPLDGSHFYIFDDIGGMLAFPTHDGCICLAVGSVISGFHEFRKDIEGNFMKIVDMDTELSARVRNGKREERFIGTADQPNYFRRPYGPGWALVGDAGYHRDFGTGLGITDAFRDAELLAEAIDEGFSGRRPLEDALGGYEQRRNEFAKPLYDITTSLAAGENIEPTAFIAFGEAMARQMPA
jgi:flavin-dependent dehydrogenase